jgi:hypothetical protein
VPLAWNRKPRRADDGENLGVMLVPGLAETISYREDHGRGRLTNGWRRSEYGGARERRSA